jgi:hypothetical protein
VEWGAGLRVATFRVLEWSTGMVEHWNGVLEWSVGMEYWNGGVMVLQRLCARETLFTWVVPRYVPLTFSPQNFHGNQYS